MSHDQSLTENRLHRKRNAVIADFGHREGVRQAEKLVKKPKSTLQEIFLKRVKEEMKNQGIENPTQLSKRVGAPPQTTLNDILSLHADPRLSQVHKIAIALDVPAVSLLTETSGSSRPSGNISTLPGVPPIATKSGPKGSRTVR